MKFKNLTTAMLASTVLSISAAQADDIYSLTNGTFQFYDATGVESLADGHTNVFADGITSVTHATLNSGNPVISQLINFTSGTGRLITTSNFNGVPWVADVADIQVYDGNGAAGAQTFTYTWNERTYANATFSIIVTCRVSSNLDGCTDEEADITLSQLGADRPSTYSYNLLESQYALELFFDWNGTEDIPVLAVFNIDSIAANGALTSSSVDTGDAGFDCSSSPCTGGPAGDGVPGTRMATSPFPEQSAVFSGVFVPTSNDAPISGVSAALSTNEDTLLTLTAGNFNNTGDFTYNAAAFPSNAFTSTSKALFIDAGTNYTTNGTTNITPSLNIDQDISINVGITISSNNSATFVAPVTINAQEDDPVISGSPSTSASTAALYTFTPTISDPDTGDDVICSIASTTALPTGITFDGGSIAGGATCTLSGTTTSPLAYVAQDIIITVTDDSGSALTADLAQFSITVFGPNVAPSLAGTPVSTIDEDASYSFTVTGTDSGDTMTYSLSGAPGWMSISPTAALQASGSVATISGTPLNGDVGTTGTISVIATDSFGLTDQIDYVVAVNNTNDIPAIGAGTCSNTTVEARSAFTSCAPTFSDDDEVHGEVLTLSATGLPASLSIDPTSGAIAGTTLDSDVAGSPYTVVVTVSDDETPTAATDTFSFQIDVTAFIAAPVTAGANLSTPQDVVIDSVANLSDAYDSLATLVTGVRGCEPGCYVFSIPPGGNPAHGSLTIDSATGNYVYTPDAGYNGRDQFKYIVSDGVKVSNEATVNLVVGVILEDQYLSSNFTMIDSSGTTFGGTNDLIANWNGNSTQDITSTVFDEMTLFTITPFNGFPWIAHHIRVFGEGSYTFDTTCTVAQLESAADCSGNPLQTQPKQQVIRNVSMTVGPGQLGAHILFDWSATSNIDVLVVWNIDDTFAGPDKDDPADPLNDPANPAVNAALFQGIGVGPYPWSNAPVYTSKWRLASQDVDGDGVAGIKMVDGPFDNFQANFNLDIVTDASNMTLLSAAGTTVSGANDVNANWTGGTTNDLASVDFSAMRLSSNSPLTAGATTSTWTAHHIRVFSEGTYQFDTACTIAQLEAGTTECGGTKMPMTVAAGQTGAHILLDWGTETNIDIVNVWDTGTDDANRVFATNSLYVGANFGSYPWLVNPPATDTKWRMVSLDTDADTIPGAMIVDGGDLNGFSINFNIFVAGGGTAVIVPEEHEVDDPDLGGGSAFSLLALYMLWLGMRFGFRRKQ